MTEKERALRDCVDLLNNIYEEVQKRQMTLNAIPGSATKFEKQMIILMHKKDALFAEYGL